MKKVLAEEKRLLEDLTTIKKDHRRQADFEDKCIMKN
jgi:hypothetical protein